MVIYHRPKFFRMTHVLIGDPVELTEYYDRKLSEEELAQADEKLRQIMIKMLVTLSGAPRFLAMFSNL